MTDLSRPAEGFGRPTCPKDHYWLEVTAYDDQERHFACRDCDAMKTEPRKERP